MTLNVLNMVVDWLVCVSNCWLTGIFTDRKRLKGETIQCWCQWSEGDWHQQSVPNAVASERFNALQRCTFLLPASHGRFHSFFFMQPPITASLFTTNYILSLYCFPCRSVCLTLGRLYEGCRSILSAESPPFSLTTVFLPSAPEAGHPGDVF